MAAGSWQVLALLILCVQSQQQPEVQAQTQRASQPALRGANKTMIDSSPDMASMKELLMENTTAQYQDEKSLEVPDVIRQNHMVRMEKLLSDNETLSAMDSLPIEYELENTTAQNQDEEDLEAHGGLNGYKYKGINNHYNICPAGGYLKSMQMVFGAEGGKTPGIPATFFSERGFEKLLFSLDTPYVVCALEAHALERVEISSRSNVAKDVFLLVTEQAFRNGSMPSNTSAE